MIYLLMPIKKTSNAKAIFTLNMAFCDVIFFTLKYTNNPYQTSNVIACPDGKLYPSAFASSKTRGRSLSTSSFISVFNRWLPSVPPANRKPASQSRNKYHSKRLIIIVNGNKKDFDPNSVIQ